MAFVGDSSTIEPAHGRSASTAPRAEDACQYRDRTPSTMPMRPQAAHACAPWLVTWDDHEVATTTPIDRGQDLDPGVPRRPPAGYRACFEHLLRPSVLRPRGNTAYARMRGGRSRASSCSTTPVPRAPAARGRSPGGSNVVTGLRQRTTDGRTMLGSAQQPGSTASLRHRNRAGTQRAADADAPAGRRPPTASSTDRLLDVIVARARLLESLAHRAPPTPSAGGDGPRLYVANLQARPAGAVAVLAAEFCGTYSSSGPNPKVGAAIRTRTAHRSAMARSAASDARHGRERLEARLRVLNRARTDAAVSTAATFTVIAGRPGLAPEKINAAGIPRRLTRSIAAGNRGTLPRGSSSPCQGITESWCLPALCRAFGGAEFLHVLHALRELRVLGERFVDFFMRRAVNARAEPGTHRGDGGKARFNDGGPLGLVGERAESSAERRQ